MMLAFGVGFEFPIVLVFLQLAGILSSATLRKYRRYSIVGITILVAVITPSGDPISMLALTIPEPAGIILGRSPSWSSFSSSPSCLRLSTQSW